MLMNAARSSLVVVDLQERLMPAIAGGEGVLRQAGILIEAARTLGVPVLASEQYPKGLGPTVPAIKQLLPNDAQIIGKLTFSATKEPAFLDALEKKRKDGRYQAVVCGTETHVCVLQTALDLKARGYEVYLVGDACGSRAEENRSAALARMAAEGVRCVTTEMALFEWLEVAGGERFKTVTRLIK